MHELILNIVRYLRPLNEWVRVAQVHAAFTDHPPGDVDEALGLLDQTRLIRATFQRDSLQLTPEGRTAADDQCVLELIYGLTYVNERYSPSAVHIVVRGRDRDESGGTGFFCSDYPGKIVTASHILENREIIRIEDSSLRVISGGPFEMPLGADGLDLALLSCDPPEHITPLRIEWRRELIQAMQQLLILGFPQYPNHMPALHHARAELHTVTTKFGAAFSSLIISSVTRPGFSGGPVINERGRVIGIVEQENIAEGENRHPTAFFSAIPAYYCRSVLAPP